MRVPYSIRKFSIKLFALENSILSCIPAQATLTFKYTNQGNRNKPIRNRHFEEN